MKKQKIFTILIILLIVPVTVFAQIKLNSSGKVSVGDYQPSASYNLYTGTARFLDNVYFQSGNLGINTTPSSSYSMKVYCYPPVNFYESGGETILISSESYSLYMYPTVNNTCYLGRSDKSFHTIYYNNLALVSDKRLKENIRDIDNALDIVTKLKGVKYDIKEEFMEEKIEGERKDHYGFLAQDVDSVYKYAVSYDEIRDIYGIDYTKFVPILVESIKELKEEIEVLKMEKTTELQAKSISGDKSSTAVFDSEIQSYLGNNVPNPFYQNTEIEFYLPQEISNADFYIYDLQGKQIRKINVVEREYGSIVIEGSQLTPGMYYYSLIADNQVIGTKQMILTD